MAVLGSYVQQPAETVDYDIDYSEFLPDTDELASATPPTVAITPGGPSGLEVAAVNVASPQWLKILLRGGVSGQRYKVEVTATTNEGRVRQDEFHVFVRDI